MEDKILYGLNGLEYVSIITQANELFQLIQLILTIATTLFILIIKIISWYNKAKKDGKIDNNELEELSNILEEGKEKIKDDTQKRRNDKSN